MKSFLICVCIVLIVATGACSTSTRRNDTFAFVIEHEVLLREAVLDIGSADWDFEGRPWRSISLESIENETLRSALERKELCKITAVENGIGFCFGGSRQFEFGFYYSNDGNPIFILDGSRVAFTQDGDRWVYRPQGNTYHTERIVGNFFYYAMHW